MSNDRTLDIRLANADVKTTQGRREENENAYDVVASLIFKSPVRIKCEYGEIAVGVSEAVFSLRIQHGRLRQLEHGYRRNPPDKLEGEYRESSTKSRARGWGWFARFGAIGRPADAEFGANVAAGVGAEASTLGASSTSRGGSAHNNRYLVWSEGEEQESNTSRWRIRNPIPDEPLKYDVFADDDPGGRLGVLRTQAPESCRIEPALEIRPYTEIAVLDESTFHTNSDEQIFRDRLRKKEKLAAIIIGEDGSFSHVNFPPVKPNMIRDND